MAEKSGKKPGDGDDPGVLASLPSTRPNRLSRRGRDGDGAAPKAKAKPAAAKRKAKPKAAAKPKPAAADPTPIAAAGDKQQRPTAVRAGHPTLTKPPATPPAESSGQSGLDLVKTVVQAAGEVAQIGATVGGQILKRAVDKLPRKP